MVIIDFKFQFYSLTSHAQIFVNWAKARFAKEGRRELAHRRTDFVNMVPGACSRGTVYEKMHRATNEMSKNAKHSAN